MSTYCCFLPDLTGFVGSCCAGPKHQHQSTKADHTVVIPQMGIRPRYSGLRVQGTATSPLSTALIIITILEINCKNKGGSARPVTYKLRRLVEKCEACLALALPKRRCSGKISHTQPPNFIISYARTKVEANKLKYVNGAIRYNSKY